MQDKDHSERALTNQSIHTISVSMERLSMTVMDGCQDVGFQRDRNDLIKDQQLR